MELPERVCSMGQQGQHAKLGHNDQGDAVTSSCPRSRAALMMLLTISTLLCLPLRQRTVFFQYC